MSLNTTSQTQEAITALDTLVKQNGFLMEKIDAFDGEVSDAYDYLESKGAIMPEDKTIENLPATIEQIVGAHTGIRLTSMNVQNSPENENVDLSNIVYFGTALDLYGLSNIKTLILPKTNTVTTFRMLGCTLLTYIDLRGLSGCILASDSYGTVFDGCNSLINLDISMLNTTYVTNMQYYFRNCISLTNLNALNIDMSSVTNVGSMFQGCRSLQTLIGGKTYEEVISDAIHVLDNLNVALSLSPTALDRASLRAVINGLADRTEQSALTLTMGATLLAKLSAEDIAVATNKNWTIA